MPTCGDDAWGLDRVAGPASGRPQASDARPFARLIESATALSPAVACAEFAVCVPVRISGSQPHLAGAGSEPASAVRLHSGCARLPDPADGSSPRNSMFPGYLIAPPTGSISAKHWAAENSMLAASTTSPARTSSSSASARISNKSPIVGSAVALRALLEPFPQETDHETLEQM